MTVLLQTTADELQLPIAVYDTVKEASRGMGVSASTLWLSLWRQKHDGRLWRIRRQGPLGEEYSYLMRVDLDAKTPARGEEDEDDG